MRDILRTPHHPYTRALLSAVRLDPDGQAKERVVTNLWVTRRHP